MYIWYALKNICSRNVCFAPTLYSDHETTAGSDPHHLMQIAAGCSVDSSLWCRHRPNLGGHPAVPYTRFGKSSTASGKKTMNSITKIMAR